MQKISNKLHQYMMVSVAVVLFVFVAVVVWISTTRSTEPVTESIVSNEQYVQGASVSPVDGSEATTTASTEAYPIVEEVAEPAPQATPHTPTDTSAPLVSTAPSAATSSRKVPAYYKRATTTVFWVGEGESEDNGYIHNRASAWDEDWVGTFGGVDDPDNRCGYRPCAFVPAQGAFYVALPYLEYTDDGYKDSAREVPWFTDGALNADTLLHGRWVEVRAGNKVCFGEWRDVGPFETDDFAYVFGSTALPRNTEGERAGLDVSPAMRDCLGVSDVSVTWWRHVESSAVPDGPWR